MLSSKEIKLSIISIPVPILCSLAIIDTFNAYTKYSYKAAFDVNSFFKVPEGNENYEQKLIKWRLKARLLIYTDWQNYPFIKYENNLIHMMNIIMWVCFDVLNKAAFLK